MKPSRKRPAVPLSKVPSVKELCDRLGFERASPIETSIFTDTTHAFRKSYKTSNGSAGSSLIDWYSSEVQQELSAMAMNFLEQGGNGERFWSDSRRWRDVNDLSWPEDRLGIVELLKQLFWKQNKYALNNQTYGEKKYGESRDQSRDRTSPTREFGLATSVDSSPTFGSFFGTDRPKYLGPLPTSERSVQPQKPVTSTSSDERADAVNVTKGHSLFSKAAPRMDIFDVPEDDLTQVGNHSTVDSIRNGNLKKVPSKSSPKSSNKESPGGSPPAKRPRIGDKDNGKKSSQRILASPKRTSTRPKVPRVRPETASDDQIEELFKEKTPEDRLHSINKPIERPKSISTSITGWERPSRPPLFGEPGASSPLSISSKTPSPIMPTNGERRDPFQAQVSDQQPNRDSPKIKSTDISSGEGTAQAVRSREHKRESQTQAPAPQENTSSIRGSQRQESFPESATQPRAQLPVRKSFESSISPDPASKPVSKVRGTFWIVTSPEPDYAEESWHNGQIKGKSLSKVIEEISSITNRDYVEKLKIKLKTSFAQTTTTVQKDAEDHWEITKSNLEEKIKEAFRRDKNQQNHFQIWIEPLYEHNNLLGRTANVENEEIDW